MDKDQRWISKNFNMLIDHYGGRYVAVVNRKVVSVGRRPEIVERQGSSVAGKKMPVVVRVPLKRKEKSAFNPFRLFHLS